MSKVKVIISTIMFAIMGVVLIVIGIKDYSGLRNPKDFLEMDSGDVEKGMYVKGVTNFVLDQYCTETETTLGVFDKETFRWYLIPYGKEMDRYIGVKVGGATNFEKYDQVMADTWAYLNYEIEEPGYDLVVQGKIRRCSGDVKKFLLEYADNYSEAVGEDCSDMFVEYYIDLTTSKAGVSYIVGGVVLLIFGVIYFLIYANKIKKEENRLVMQEKYHTMSAGAAQNVYANGMGTADKQGFYNTSGDDDLDRLLREEDEKYKREKDNNDIY